MYDQMPTRIQQRLTSALDNRCAPVTGLPGYDETVVRTGVSTFTCSTEGDGLDLTLTLTCNVPWVAYSQRTPTADHTSARPLAYGLYQLKLHVLVFGCRLQLLAAEPLTIKDSAAISCRATTALESIYLNVDYLWRELFN